MGITGIFETSGAPSRNKIDAFVDAAGRGDLKSVTSFLDRHGNTFANSRYNVDGGSALFLALVRGHGEVAKELIARGADLKERNKWGDETLLIRLAREKFPGMVQLLLDAGSDPTEVNDRGQTALDVAKRLHSNDIIKVLDPSFDVTKAPDAATVKKFVEAAGKGDLAAVQDYLKKYGSAYVNDADENGLTALRVSAWNGHVPVILELHANGADLELKDSYYKRPAVHWAIDLGQPEAARTLIRLGATVDDETMEVAKRRKCEALILRELEKRDNRAQHAADPAVPLLSPDAGEVDKFVSDAGAGELASVAAFLEEFGGEHLNDRSKYGSTALLSAIWNGKGDMVKDLEKRGAVIDTECLERAIQAGRKDMTREFIGRGIAFDEKCLVAAVLEDDMDSFKLMLDRIPNVDMGIYSNSATLLILAGMQGKTDMARELLDRGANIDARTAAGNTAWELAMHFRHEGVAQLLEAEAEHRAGAKAAPSTKVAPAIPS